MPNQDKTSASQADCNHLLSPEWPKLKVIEDDDGRQVIVADHPDRNAGSALLMAALNIHDVIFFDAIVNLLAYGGEGGRIDVGMVNFKLAFIIDRKPSSQLEILNAAILADVFVATMKSLAELNGAQCRSQIEAREPIAGRLVRNYAALLDSITRCQVKNRPLVAVQNVAYQEPANVSPLDSSTLNVAKVLTNKMTRAGHARYRPGNV
jgi:hypothetical protein